MPNISRVTISFILVFLIGTACASVPFDSLEGTSTPDLTAKRREEAIATSTRIWECRGPFVEVTNLTEEVYDFDKWEKIQADPSGYWLAIVAQLIRAGEAFLQNCAGSDLEQLSKWAQVVPLAYRCGRSSFYHYLPTTQRIDVNQDGSDEIILHTQIAYCAPTSRVEGLGSGGISLIFFQDQQSGEWTGQVIWPIQYFVDRSADDLGIAFWYHPEPRIQMLNMRDSQGRTFMAVFQLFSGSGLDTANELTVLRWEEEAYDIVLQDRLLASCQQPTEWEFREDGAILIPFAEKVNDRCEQRDAKLYVLENDEIVATEP